MFHIVPFLAGAAAGAAITDIVKDRDARNRIRENAEKVADGVKDGIDRTRRAASALTRSGSGRIERNPGPDASSSAH